MGPMKLLRHLEVIITIIIIIIIILFYRKDKAKLCFLQQDFIIYEKKKLEHELNEF